MTTDWSTSGRQRKRVDLALEDVSGDGSFSGYASLFGAVDLGRDVIEPGAFAASLKRRGASDVRMLYQHDPDQPIGRWLSIREDSHGLHVEGKLSLGVARAREVHELMKSGALDGLSIGFQTLRARNEAKSGVRRILSADLWEISVVTFPMQPGARVTAVKSAHRGGTDKTRTRTPAHAGCGADATPGARADRPRPYGTFGQAGRCAGGSQTAGTRSSAR
jgi:HK97 family phage prohead protease